MLEQRLRFVVSATSRPHKNVQLCPYQNQPNIKQELENDFIKSKRCGRIAIWQSQLKLSILFIHKIKSDIKTKDFKAKFFLV